MEVKTNRTFFTCCYRTSQHGYVIRQNGEHEPQKKKWTNACDLEVQTVYVLLVKTLVLLLLNLR